MPAENAVLLPLCVGLTLLGLIVTGVAWRRGSKGRVLQGLALALAPVALYFSGLLRLVWNAVVAVGTWATRVVLSPIVWGGLGLLALCVVLWIVGGVVARHYPRRPRGAKAARSGSTGPTVASTPRSSGNAVATTKKGRPAAVPVDDDMAEIEALLKSRGIS